MHTLKLALSLEYTYCQAHSAGSEIHSSKTNTNTVKQWWKANKVSPSQSRSPLEWQGKLSASNIIKMVPGPTRYADSHVQDIKSAFELFITPSIESIYLGTVGKTLMWLTCKPTLGCSFWLDCTSQKAKQQQDFEMLTRRSIFPATMSLKTFHVFSRVIHFDNKETRQGRWSMVQLGPAITLSLQSRPPHHCGCMSGSISWLLSLQTIHAKHTSQIWHKNTGCMWCTVHLCLEYAGVHW